MLFTLYISIIILEMGEQCVNSNAIFGKHEIKRIRLSSQKVIAIDDEI